MDDTNMKIRAGYYNVDFNVSSEFIEGKIAQLREHANSMKQLVAKYENEIGFLYEILMKREEGEL